MAAQLEAKSNNLKHLNYYSNNVKRTTKSAPTISNKTEAYLAACSLLKIATKTVPSKQYTPAKNEFPRMEAVARIGSIPLVETGMEIGEKIYTKIRESNSLTKWYLTTAESSIIASLNLAIPAVKFFSGPIQKIDQILCKSLDIVEQRVPSVYLPPQMMYSNAQDYMSSHIVKPVLRRADSVKQLGTAVLDSRMTAFAAVTLDSALDKADIYVDKYLPADSQDAVDSAKPESGPLPLVCPGEAGANRQKAVQTMQHADRFSRKLQRRLTRRTLQEAKALREQTTEAIHVLVYVAELVASDPVLAFAKAKELWASLSKDEPENQAPPTTLEHLVVLLTRESARRVVHLINFTASGAAKLSKSAISGVRVASRHFLSTAHAILKITHLDDNKFVKETKAFRDHFNILLATMLQHSKNILEQMAKFIAGSSEREKHRTPRCHLRNNHIFNANNVINGVN